jgi:hypothetical protein
MITGKFTLYELVLICLWIATSIRQYIAFRAHRVHSRQIAQLKTDHKIHTGQIAQLENMHTGVTVEHPPEPSP